MVSPKPTLLPSSGDGHSIDGRWSSASTESRSWVRRGSRNLGQKARPLLSDSVEANDLLDGVVIRLIAGLAPAIVFRVFRVFRVGYDDDLAQDLVKLVTARLFVPSPLDEEFQAQRLNRFPGVYITCFPQEVVVAGMCVSNVRKNGKLDTTR